MPQVRRSPEPPPAEVLLYHFCRLQLPGVPLTPERLAHHLKRTYALARDKATGATAWPAYLENLYPVDWLICCGCLDGDRRAWDYLFGARALRGDCLLVDALRARAARLYPRDEERQESAVSEFWSRLLVADAPEAPGVLARYDGQRPLVPWLIRVFQNWHVSQLRRGPVRPLPPDDLALPAKEETPGRWREVFCEAAREALATLGEQELLILGLRFRYRLSQREVARLLGLHEGTVSRQTDHLRDRLLAPVSQRLLEEGWIGEDLADFVLGEMGSLLLDEPRLSADRLAALLAARGKRPPAE